MEHWVEEVVPEAIKTVSENAGGSAGARRGLEPRGIFSLLVAADRPDLPIGSLLVIGSRSTSSRSR